MEGASSAYGERGVPNFTAVAVRALFLQAQGIYSAVTGTDSICAEYIGTYVQGGGVHVGAGQGTGGYLVYRIT